MHARLRVCNVCRSVHNCISRMGCEMPSHNTTPPYREGKGTAAVEGWVGGGGMPKVDRSKLRGSQDRERVGEGERRGVAEARKR